MGKLVKNLDGGPFGPVRYAAGVYYLGYLVKVSMVVLLLYLGVKLCCGKTGSAGFGNGDLEAFQGEGIDLGVQKVVIKACVEHCSDYHVAGGACKTVEIAYFHSTIPAGERILADYRMRRDFVQGPVTGGEGVSGKMLQRMRDYG
jgi:hypothetical protein